MYHRKASEESVPIHRFPKRGGDRQRLIEVCANSYLSRLEYLRVVERQYFFCHRHFDKQYYYQKRNGTIAYQRIEAGPYVAARQCSQIVELSSLHL